MFEKVKGILAAQLRLDENTITLESHIKNDLHADSLDIMEMLVTIEDEYNIHIPDEKLASFQTVGDVCRYLESL